MVSTVIHFSDSSDFGGAEVALLTLLEGLDRRRWNPVLFHHENSGVRRLLDGARRLDVRTRPVPRGGGARNVWNLARLVRSERAAVFHAHLPWALRCTPGLVAAALAGAPAVIATQQLYEGITSSRRILRQWLVGLGVDRYIAVSEEMARKLSATRLFPKRKIEIIRNSVDLRRFSTERGDGLRKDLGIDSNRPIVLTLARLDPQKGLYELLDAAVRVPSAIFVVAGEGPERERLENRARSLGISGRVHFLGHREDVPELLAASDVFVLPSLFEGLPLSVLEAMAAGKPVIATAIGGTREAVRDGETGLLVPPHDAAALADAIRSVSSDPPLAARLGAAGQERARREFSAERMVRQVEQLYDTVLATRRAGRRER